MGENRKVESESTWSWIASLLPDVEDCVIDELACAIDSRDMKLEELRETLKSCQREGTRLVEEIRELKKDAEEVRKLRELAKVHAQFEGGGK